MPRFTLNEPAARGWLDSPFLLVDIPDHYTGRTDRYDGSVTGDLVCEALRARIITDAVVAPPGPGSDDIFEPALWLWYDPPANEFGTRDEDYGYHWAVSLVPGSRGAGALVVSGFMPFAGLGPGLSGAELAMVVLREAVEVGNGLCDAIAAYHVKQGRQ